MPPDLRRLIRVARCLQDAVTRAPGLALDLSDYHWRTLCRIGERLRDTTRRGWHTAAGACRAAFERQVWSLKQQIDDSLRTLFLLEAR